VDFGKLDIHGWLILNTRLVERCFQCRKLFIRFAEKFRSAVLLPRLPKRRKFWGIRWIRVLIRPQLPFCELTQAPLF
jgi:hypothetical protein